MTYFIQLLFGATLLLLAGIIACALFRNAAASLRYRIGTFTMLGLLLLPILSAMLPTMYVVSDDTIRNLPIAALINDVVVNNTVKKEPGTERSAVLGQTAVTVADSSVVIRSDYILLPIWFLGTAFFLFHLLVSILAIRKMLAPLENVSDSMLDRLRQELGIKKTVRLVYSETSTVPFINGMLRPTIVLPLQSQNWNEQERRAVLTHELTHITRNDLFWQLLTQIACAFYWFHPLVWLAANRIGIERESACDDAVMLRGEKPSVYANLLLELANALRATNNQRAAKVTERMFGCTVAITRKSNIVKRIQAILNPSLCRTPLGKIGTGLFFVLAAGVIILIATVSPFGKRNLTMFGTLEPVIRHPIYSPLDAEIKQLFVDSNMKVQGPVLNEDGIAIQKGTTLLELRSPELRAEEIRLSGVEFAILKELEMLDQQLHNLLSDSERAELVEQRKKVAAQREAARWELDIFNRDQRSQLVITSPIDGTVISYNLGRRLLKNRPVARMQHLMEIANLDGPWHLELQASKKQREYIMEQQREHPNQPLRVSFVVAVSPARKFYGTIEEVPVDADRMIKVALDDDIYSFPTFLRPSAQVSARIAER